VAISAGVTATAMNEDLGKDVTTSVVDPGDIYVFAADPGCHRVHILL
jgi:hypothetical protein